MNSVSVANLPVGSYVDKPVYLDNHYILLSPDVPITEELKKRLQTWSFNKVFSDGTLTDTPPTDSEAAVPVQSEGGNGSEDTRVYLGSDLEEREKQKEADAFFKSMTAFLSDVFEHFLKSNDFQMNRISEQVKECIDHIKVNRKYLMQLHNLNDPDHNYLITHAVKTTIISLILADVLKLPPFKQIEVGMGGLLHEIGMLRLPAQLYMSTKAFSNEEKKAIHAHPILGFRILKAAGFPMSVTRAVLEHHEWVDGSGYPRGLTGDKISFYAKLIAVAGSYSAIVSKRPFREASNGHNGILDLLKNTGKQYDDKIIRVLVYTLSIYPVGTYVRLANGALGVVYETDSEKPRFPIVKLLINESGAVLREQPLLHTNESDGTQVERPLDSKEIGRLIQETTV